MKQNWMQLAAIQIGGAICLPVILIGIMLAKQYGWQSALLGIAIGNLFLLGIGIIYVRITLANRKTTMENAKEYFGERGGVLFAGVMALSFTGWFAIQLNVITLSLQQLGLEIIGLDLVVGIIITLTALKGMRSLQLLSDLSVPFLVGTLFYSLWNSDVKAVEMPLTFGAVSMVIAASISAVVDLPTYFRHAKSERDGIIAITALFLFTVPFVEGCGILLATELFENIWMAPFLVLAGWTTNATNLYSNVACMQTAVPQLKERTRILMMGLLGTALACCNILEHFEMVLECMSIAVTAMGAVIAIRYMLTGPLVCRGNFIAWGVGTLSGYLVVFGSLTVTTIPQLDAFLVASILTGGLREKAYA